jgi:hypothetical protein
MIPSGLDSDIHDSQPCEHPMTGSIFIIFVCLGTAISAWAQTNSLSSPAESGTCNKPPPPPTSPTLVQTLESFGNEYEWINVKRCRRPSAKSPPRIWIEVPKNIKSKEKKISIRRWADRDGDGICEIYDVEEAWKGEDLDEESVAARNDDPVYPMRTMKFEKGKWRIPEGWSNIWVPMILRDKVSGARIEIPYKAGYAGADKMPMSFNTQFQGSCEATRLKLAVGYMLHFHFPKFAMDDAAMSPRGKWNDYGDGFFWSEYWELSDSSLDNLPDDCREKYRLVIDALKTKGEFSK